MLDTLATVFFNAGKFALGGAGRRTSGVRVQSLEHVGEFAPTLVAQHLLAIPN
jgi:hypothetical protein